MNKTAYERGFDNTCFTKYAIINNPFPVTSKDHAEFIRGELDGVLDYERSEEV